MENLFARLPITFAACAPLLHRGGEHAGAQAPSSQDSAVQASNRQLVEQTQNQQDTLESKGQQWKAIDQDQANMIKAQPFSAARNYLIKRKGKASDDTAKLAPAIVVAWVAEEIKKLDAHFDEAAKAYDTYDKARKERVAKRRVLYPVFADALLRSCLANEEEFIDKFCEWAWASIACYKADRIRIAEVEHFLRKFLAGKTSGSVTREGLCGADLAAPTFFFFVEKLKASQDRLDLDERKRKRIRIFLDGLLDRLQKSIRKDREKNLHEFKAQKMKKKLLKKVPWATEY